MKRRKHRRPTGKFLQSEAQVRVRFQEVDALCIVWHGHYLSYFESGRVEFGARYGIEYTDLLNAGLLIPVVHASCEYLRSATFNDDLRVITRLYPQASARIHFHFTVLKRETDETLATGETVHAFTDLNHELCLTIPPFMQQWYSRWAAEMTSDE